MPYTQIGIDRRGQPVYALVPTRSRRTVRHSRPSDAELLWRGGTQVIRGGVALTRGTFRAGRATVRGVRVASPFVARGTSAAVGAGQDILGFFRSQAREHRRRRALKRSGLEVY